MYEELWNEFKNWLEEQKLRNSEWNKFLQIDGRVGIPISYLLNKMNELEGVDNNVGD